MGTGWRISGHGWPPKPPRGKSLPQARLEGSLRWGCPRPALSFARRLFPQQPPGVVLALGMGSPASGCGAGRLGAWRSVLCGLADPHPPYPRGFTRWRPTLSSRTQSSGLEIRTPRSPAPASKPREQPSGWLGVQERNWGLTHSRRSIHVFEMNERMWQCPVLKLGEGRDDLDTMERDPTPQNAGATGGGATLRRGN